MRKILIDFDNTIAMSAEAIISIMTGIEQREVEPKILEWSFRPYAKNSEDTAKFVEMFKSPRFWEELKPMDGFLSWLKRQKENSGVPVLICSRRLDGQFDNLISWCRRFGIDEFIDDYALISKSYGTKSYLVDDETVIIDDNPSCFNGSEIGTRIIFGYYAYSSKCDNFTKRVSVWEDMDIFK